MSNYRLANLEVAMKPRNSFQNLDLIKKVKMAISIIYAPKYTMEKQKRFKLIKQIKRLFLKHKAKSEEIAN